MLLPENAVVRRINELVKRARSVKVHAYIIHYLRKQMPYMMGKQEKQVSTSPAVLTFRLFLAVARLRWHTYIAPSVSSGISPVLPKLGPQCFWRWFLVRVEEHWTILSDSMELVFGTRRVAPLVVTLARSTAGW